MHAGTDYAFSVQLAIGIEDARRRIESALQAEGFGILTEIDVAATLRGKLGVESTPYLILGACNPSLAHRALQIEPSIGALLPCNVVLRQAESANETIVEIAEPLTFLSVAANPRLSEVAAEASARLHRVASGFTSTH